LSNEFSPLGRGKAGEPDRGFAIAAGPAEETARGDAAFRVWSGVSARLPKSKKGGHRKQKHRGG